MKQLLFLASISLALLAAPTSHAKDIDYDARIKKAMAESQALIKQATDNFLNPETQQNYPKGLDRLSDAQKFFGLYLKAQCEYETGYGEPGSGTGSELTIKVCILRKLNERNAELKSTLRGCPEGEVGCAAY